MQNIVKSFGEAFKALFHFKVLLWMLVPPAVAFLAGLVLYFFFWSSALHFLTDSMTHTWIYDYLSGFTDKDYSWVVTGITITLLILLFIPLSYVLSVLISSIVVIPVLQSYLAEKKFGYLEKKQSGNWAVSILNSVFATVVYLFFFVATLPLWLVPGLQILIPMILTGWLHRRIYSYESLLDFASKEERKQILDSHSGPLFGMGLFCGVLVYIPFISLFAPVFTGLSFFFYNLKRLEELRQSRSTQDKDLDPSLV